ncbi:MAG: SRPBCC family protein [Halobacteriales archaeon]
MATVTRSRTIDAAPERVERAVTDDVEAFLAAADYDAVRVDGDRVELERTVGLATLSLTLRRVEDADAVLAFEQESGLFEAMTMRYRVEPADGKTELSASTEFTLGGVTGSVLDDTVVRRQRASELAKQFDYVADVAE